MRLLFCQLLTLCVLMACGTTEKSPDHTGHLFVTSPPDTAINDLVQLRNPSSTPDSIKQRIDSTGKVVFTTRDEMEYLIAYQDPAQPLGSFIGIELTGPSSELTDYPVIHTSIDHFITNRGLHKFTPVKYILKTKGEPFNKNEHNGVTKYQYFAEVDGNDAEMYVFEIEEVVGTIGRMRFGFVPIDTAEKNKRVPVKVR